MDLKKFRKIAAGDRLRGQYQGLSQDPNSLSNLDQVCLIVFVLFYWAMVSDWDLGFPQRSLFGMGWDEVLIHHFIFALGKKKTLTKVDLHNTVSLVGGLLLLSCTLWKQLLTLTLHNRICQTTWFTKYPSSPSPRSGCGVKHGVMTPRRREQKPLIWWVQDDSLTLTAH